MNIGRDIQYGGIAGPVSAPPTTSGRIDQCHRKLSEARQAAQDALITASAVEAIVILDLINRIASAMTGSGSLMAAMEADNGR